MFSLGFGSLCRGNGSTASTGRRLESIEGFPIKEQTGRGLGSEMRILGVESVPTPAEELRITAIIKVIGIETLGSNQKISQKE